MDGGDGLVLLYSNKPDVADFLPKSLCLLIRSLSVFWWLEQLPNAFCLYGYVNCGHLAPCNVNYKTKDLIPSHL